MKNTPSIVFHLISVFKMFKCEYLSQCTYLFFQLQEKKILNKRVKNNYINIINRE